MFVEVHTYSGLAFSWVWMVFSLLTDSRKKTSSKKVFDRDYNDQEQIVFGDDSFKLEKHKLCLPSFLPYARPP